MKSNHRKVEDRQRNAKSQKCKNTSLLTYTLCQKLGKRAKEAEVQTGEESPEPGKEASWY